MSDKDLDLGPQSTTVDEDETTNEAEVAELSPGDVPSETPEEVEAVIVEDDPGKGNCESSSGSEQPEEEEEDRSEKSECGKSDESERLETESTDDGLSDGATSTSSSGSEREKKKKSNRCHVCRKKVGLTGFVCRCGGLFCSIHRYSDKHDCSFNYILEGQAEIRRNNPQIIAQKIKKI